MSHPGTVRSPVLGQHLRNVLFLGLATFATGCGTAPENEGRVSTRQPLANPLAPATCQELKNANPSFGEGEYKLYLGNDLNRPWKAWCRDMNGTPSEYLTLVNTAPASPSSNYSQYTAGITSPGTDVRTNYTRLRINPTTLNVDIEDQTFSSSSGELLHAWRDTVTSMPYAIAMSCGYAQPVGLGNIDLRGTPFKVIPGQLIVRGNAPIGSVTYSQDNRVVGLTGGGYCGWAGLPGNNYSPYNQGGIGELGLAYAP